MTFADRLLQSRLKKTLGKLTTKDATVKIQALTEGLSFDIEMESLLTGKVLSDVPGTSNQYQTYSSQVINAYKKYNGNSEFGCAQVRTEADTRVAVIGGEGLSITPGKKCTKQYQAFFKKFLNINGFDGIRFFDVVLQTEIEGFSLLRLVRYGDTPVVLTPGTQFGKNKFKPVLRDFDDTRTVQKIKVTPEKGDEYTIDKYFVYIRTGGVGCVTNDPTTRIGLSLQACDNYDMAQKDLRQLNYRMARITPWVKCAKDSDVKTTKDNFIKSNWKIGDMFIGTGEFGYASPKTDAISNLKEELAANAKTISALTGLPMHWLGHTDLMSNRATAEELYNLVNLATIKERTEIANGFKNLLVIMQEFYIDNIGGGEITTVCDDFEVTIPLMDLGRFKETMETWIGLFNNELVSSQTVLSKVPGIDSLEEQKRIKEESDKKAKEAVTRTILSGGENGRQDETFGMGQSQDGSANEEK